MTPASSTQDPLIRSTALRGALRSIDPGALTVIASLLAQARNDGPGALMALVDELTREARFYADRQGETLSLLDQLALKAFDYALGRRTYIVLALVDWLVPVWEHLGEETRSEMIVRVRRALDADKAGDACDRDCWQRLLDLEGAEEVSCA